MALERNSQADSPRARQHKKEWKQQRTRLQWVCVSQKLRTWLTSLQPKTKNTQLTEFWRQENEGEKYTASSYLTTEYFLKANKHKTQETAKGNPLLLLHTRLKMHPRSLVPWKGWLWSGLWGRRVSSPRRKPFWESYSVTLRMYELQSSILSSPCRNPFPMPLAQDTNV